MTTVSIYFKLNLSEFTKIFSGAATSYSKTVEKLETFQEIFFMFPISQKWNMLVLGVEFQTYQLYFTQQWKERNEIIYRDSV